MRFGHASLTDLLKLFSRMPTDPKAIDFSQQIIDQQKAQFRVKRTMPTGAAAKKLLIGAADYEFWPSALSGVD